MKKVFDVYLRTGAGNFHQSITKRRIVGEIMLRVPRTISFALFARAIFSIRAICDQSKFINYLAETKLSRFKTYVTVIVIIYYYTPSSLRTLHFLLTAFAEFPRIVPVIYYSTCISCIRLSCYPYIRDFANLLNDAVLLIS